MLTGTEQIPLILAFCSRNYFNSSPIVISSSAFNFSACDCPTVFSSGIFSAYNFSTTLTYSENITLNTVLSLL
jgi:hypothetical protein